jgi:phage shock protein PspC (stress-responsive transcriptional regulator)
MATGQLMRSTNDRIISGVAGGTAEYFGIDPTLVRVLWAVAILSGFGALAYIILWIALPEGTSATPAIRIAEERYARGEISSEELDRMRADLKGE